jgi:uncharacterized Zn-finger protein
MVPFEIVEIDAMTASCNGSGGALGHPRVYLNLAPSGRVECPYCSKLFINPRVAHPDASADADHQPPGQRSEKGTIA